MINHAQFMYGPGRFTMDLGGQGKVVQANWTMMLPHFWGPGGRRLHNGDEIWALYYKDANDERLAGLIRHNALLRRKQYPDDEFRLVRRLQPKQQLPRRGPVQSAPYGSLNGICQKLVDEIASLPLDPIEVPLFDGLLAAKSVTLHDTFGWTQPLSIPYVGFSPLYDYLDSLSYGVIDFLKHHDLARRSYLPKQGRQQMLNVAMHLDTLNQQHVQNIVAEWPLLSSHEQTHPVARRSWAMARWYGQISSALRCDPLGNLPEFSRAAAVTLGLLGEWPYC